jgi:heat shock protein HslJ
MCRRITPARTPAKETPMTSLMRRCATVVALVVVCTALAGCSLSDPLNGTRWKLTGWSISSMDPADVAITAAFKEGQMSGNSGVNSYGGPYSLGFNGAITLGPLAMTEMAGPEPAMRAETAYQTLLADVGFYEVSGDGALTLFDKNHNQALIFTPAGG